MIFVQRIFSRPRPYAFIGGILDVLVYSTFSTHPDEEQAGTSPCQRPICRTFAFTWRMANIDLANGVVYVTLKDAIAKLRPMWFNLSIAPTVKLCKLAKLFGGSQIDSVSTCARLKVTINKNGTKTDDSPLPTIPTFRTTIPSITCVFVCGQASYRSKWDRSSGNNTGNGNHFSYPCC